jgi:hypothetical protein
MIMKKTVLVTPNNAASGIVCGKLGVSVGVRFWDVVVVVASDENDVIDWVVSEACVEIIVVEAGSGVQETLPLKVL